MTVRGGEELGMSFTGTRRGGARTVLLWGSSGAGSVRGYEELALKTLSLFKVVACSKLSLTEGDAASVVAVGLACI